MANELSIGVVLSFKKGGAVSRRAESLQVDVTGESFVHGILAIGTSEEELTQLADLGTPGYMFMKNLDATNYVEVGITTGVYTIKMKAGEIAVYRHNGATAYAKANTASCNVEYWLIED